MPKKVPSRLQIGARSAVAIAAMMANSHAAAQTDAKKIDDKKSPKSEAAGGGGKKPVKNAVDKKAPISTVKPTAAGRRNLRVLNDPIARGKKWNAVDTSSGAKSLAKAKKSEHGQAKGVAQTDRGNGTTKTRTPAGVLAKQVSSTAQRARC